MLSIPDRFNAAAHFVDPHARLRPDRVAIECGDERVTYGELVARVNRVGNALRGALGVRMEERVLLLLLDTPDFAACFFGAIKIGAVPVPVNTLLRPNDYQYLLNDSRARVAIVSQALLPQVEAIPRNNLPFLEHVIVIGDPAHGTHSFSELINAAPAELDPAPTHNDDAAFWLYSSGSTGPPKACVHLQHDMVVTSELYAKQTLRVAESDRFFSVAKLFFAYGLGNGLYFPLAVGGTSVLLPDRRIRQACSTSSSATVPRFFSLFLPTSLRCWRTRVPTAISISPVSATASPPASLSRQPSSSASSRASASRSSTPSAPPKPCTCSSPTARDSPVPAPAARSFPAWTPASSTTTAAPLPPATSATCI
jgi:acyl-coenzyme A synthetase/AMP-(fatty) acid ligase